MFLSASPESIDAPAAPARVTPAWVTPARAGHWLACARRRQRGVATLEFLIVALPLLTVGLGSVEFAHWQLTRQAVDYALMEAAREGAVTHGDPAAMRRRFDAALLPLFGGGTSRDTLAEAAARMAARAARIQADTGTAAMRLTVLGPGRPSFSDFADPVLGSQFGRRAINNDYLAQAHARDIERGWPAGRGPGSGQDRFDANLLRLRLSYLHAPLLPGVRALVQTLSAVTDAGTDAGTEDTYATQARARAGMLVMTREFSVLMQSHPVEWGVETYKAAWGAAQMGNAPMGTGTVGAIGAVPTNCQAAACLPASTPPATTPWTPTSPGTVVPGDPACGITVCCAPA